MNIFYSLDKLVVWMRIRSKALDSLIHQLRFGSGERYGLLIKDWVGYRISDFHYQFTIGVNEYSWYFGVQPNKDSPSEYWTTCKVEFNLNKVGDLSQFNEFYNYLIANCKYLDFKRFDAAIDIPVRYGHVHMFKDARRMSSIEYAPENKTVYLGVRGAHGNVKLYNKQLEQKLETPLTRLEVTMDYSRCSWGEFQRVFPKVFVFEDVPDSFTGTDLVLALAISEHSEFANLLDWRKRKKIASLLEQETLRLKPSEIDYKIILQQILDYGKGIPVEMFTELEDELDVKFPETQQFDEITGVQEEMKK